MGRSHVTSVAEIWIVCEVVCMCPFPFAVSIKSRSKYLGLSTRLYRLCSKQSGEHLRWQNTICYANIVCRGFFYSLFFSRRRQLSNRYANKLNTKSDCLGVNTCSGTFIYFPHASCFSLMSEFSEAQQVWTGSILLVTEEPTAETEWTVGPTAVSLARRETSNRGRLKAKLFIDSCFCPCAQMCSFCTTRSLTSMSRCHQPGRKSPCTLSRNAWIHFIR